MHPVGGLESLTLALAIYLLVGAVGVVLGSRFGRFRGQLALVDGIITES